MREIKFRAWYVVDACWHHLTFADLIIGRISEDSLRYENWEQYTGLHDKNGKEIYEGDIVRNGYGIPDVVTMERFPGFWLKDEKFGYEGEGLESPYYTEVIGNIHENPELLEIPK